MEIKIDTSKDSHQDIKKAIEFLKTLVGPESSTQTFETQTFDLPVSTNMGSIFGDDPEPAPKVEEPVHKKQVFKEEEYKIIPY